jgi:hypothetical protein
LVSLVLPFFRSKVSNFSMSAFLWDMMGDRDLSSVRPNPREEAETSSSSGYSPSPTQDPREISSGPSRSVDPSRSAELQAEVGPSTGVEPPTEVPCSNPVAENGDLPHEIRSSMDAHDVMVVCQTYNIGPEFKARPARSDERVCTYYEKEIAVFVHNIRMGLRLPFNSFFRSLFSAYELMPCQFAPNVYRCIIGFLEVCRRIDVIPTVDLFHLIFAIVCPSGFGGWYYFRYRMSAHSKVVIGRSSSVHGWKEKFFFVSVPADWTFNREWGEPSRRAFATPDPIASEELKTARLKFGQFSGLVDVTRPSDEMLQGIAHFLETLEG